MTYAVDDGMMTASSLNALSFKDPIHDVPTSSDGNTDLFAVEIIEDNK